MTVVQQPASRPRGPRLPPGSFDPQLAETLRRRKALSREELAQQIGASVSAVKMWETGARQPSAQLAEKLAHALGVDPALLREADFDPASSTLEEVRVRFDLSTQDIADATGSSPRLVRDVERGLRMPPDPDAWASAYRLTKSQMAACWAHSYSQEQRSPTGQAEQA